VKRVVSGSITLAIVVLIIVMWPVRFGGATQWVVVSGTSMEPAYDLGDLVMARSVARSAVGDVVVFAVPEGVGAGHLVIHRIVDVRPDGTFVTQGDNRDTPDEWSVGQQHVVGHPVLALPGVGSLVTGSFSGSLLAPLLGLAVTLALWPRRPEPARAAPTSSTAAARPRWEPAIHPLDLALAELWVDDEVRRLQAVQTRDGRTGPASRQSPRASLRSLQA
jgi:signal peptidase I